jgi:hypothetical protein
MKLQNCYSLTSDSRIALHRGSSAYVSTWCNVNSDSELINLQELLQGLGKSLVQCCVTTIVGLQQQQRLLNSGGWLEIQLVQEETQTVRMIGVKMIWLKVLTGCSQSLNTWQGKLLLLKVDLEVTGNDSMVFILCRSQPV